MLVLPQEVHHQGRWVKRPPAALVTWGCWGCQSCVPWQGPCLMEVRSSTGFLLCEQEVAGGCWVDAGIPGMWWLV